MVDGDGALEWSWAAGFRRAALSAWVRSRGVWWGEEGLQRQAGCVDVGCEGRGSGFGGRRRE